MPRDITNPVSAPSDLMDLYVKQLFSHLDTGHIETIYAKIIEDGPGLLPWVTATHGSYQLWLSYAVVELRPGGPIEAEITKANGAQEEYVRAASRDELDAYYEWAFCKNLIKIPRKEEAYRNLVSPVHFWFFMSHQRQGPVQPVSRIETDARFLHPLFFITCHQARHALVVPSYFLEDGPKSFDGWGCMENASFFVFPDFARRLFDFINDPAFRDNTLFINYYSARETAWLVPASSGAERFITAPHELLKRNWRWEEVLTMLYGSRHKEPGRRPQICKNACSNYIVKRQTLAYFSYFASMARIWMANRQH